LCCRLTGLTASAASSRARAAGFDRHLTKPIPIQKVERVFASLPE